MSLFTVSSSKILILEKIKKYLFNNYINLYMDNMRKNKSNINV